MKEASVLFVDSPVGSGFSYVDDLSLLTTDIQQITLDLAEFTKQYVDRHAEFKVGSLGAFR